MAKDLLASVRERKYTDADQLGCIICDVSAIE